MTEHTGSVESFCTCGAQLVEDALFCHKCGRPVREIPNQRPDPATAPVIPTGHDLRAAAVLPPTEISLHNTHAVRTALLMAGVATLLSLVAPFPSFLQFFWRLIVLVTAGFIAVYLYQRRTGQFLTLRAGVRLGWLTGLFCFLIGFVLTVASVTAVSAQKGGLSAIWRAQLEEYASNGPELEEAIRILESPAGLSLLVLFTLVVAFLLFTGLPMIGGALGAKVLEKEE